MYGNMDVPGILLALARAIEAAPKIDLRAREWRDWEKFVRDTFKTLKAPQRDKISFADLGIKPNGGIHNIEAVYRAATPDEQDYWSDWYLQASGVVHDLAERHDLPVEVMAAVVALISPGSKWWMNARTADQFMTFWRARLPVKHGLAIYPIQLQKLIRMLETYEATGDFDAKELDTPKVSVFWQSLVDPVALQRRLVLDGHAINIYRGEKRDLKSVRQPSQEERAAMLDAYKKAARNLGTSVQALQATTWAVWQEVTDTPQEEQQDGA